MHRYVRLAALALVLLCAQIAHGQCVEPRNAWTLLKYEPSDSGGVVGYRFRAGQAPGVYTVTRDFLQADSREYCFDNLPSNTGSWYFVASSLTADGTEGDSRSNVGCYTLSGPQCVPAPFKTDVTDVALRDAAPVTSWSRSFSFRATAGYVTDPAGTTYVLRADRYPTTRGGVTFGWEHDVEMRDRSRTVPLLVGVAHLPSTWGLTNTEFRVDLPGPGRYRIRWALGDQGYANRAFLDLRDDNAVLLAVPNQVVPIGQFLDATLVRRSAANWPTQNVAREFTFASSTLRVVLKRPADSASVIAHLSAERVP
jgi:hypothetical protein